MKKVLSKDNKLPILYILICVFYVIMNLILYFRCPDCYPKGYFMSLISVRNAFLIYFILLLLLHYKKVDLMNKILSLFILIIIIHTVYYTFLILLSSKYNVTLMNYIMNIYHIILYSYIIIALCFIKHKKNKWFYYLLIAITFGVNIIVLIFDIVNSGGLDIIINILNFIISLSLDLILVKYSYDYNKGLIKE